MPELVDLVDEEHGALSPDAPLIIMAVMCHPTDPKAAGQFLRTFFGYGLLNGEVEKAFVRVDESVVPSDIRDEIWNLLREGMQADATLATLNADSYSPARAGPVAGIVLLKALQLFKHAPKIASIEKAYHLIAQRSVKHKPWGTLSALKAAMSRYRPACHLWAAWVLWQLSMPYEMEFVIDTAKFPDISEDELETVVSQATDNLIYAIQNEGLFDDLEWWQEQNLAEFLTCAEQLRLTAQGCVSKGSSRGPLLRENEMLTVPSCLILPDYPPYQFPPLYDFEWAQLLR